MSILKGEYKHRNSMSFNFLSFLGKLELSHDELDNYLDINCIKSPFDHGGSNWICNICKKTSHLKGDIKRHIEAKHVILPVYTCDVCKTTSKTRHALRLHMKKFHDQVQNFEQIQTHGLFNL